MLRVRLLGNRRLLVVTFHGKQQVLGLRLCDGWHPLCPRCSRSTIHTCRELSSSLPNWDPRESFISYEVAAEPGGCDSDFRDSTVGRALELERPGSHPGSITYPSGTWQDNLPKPPFSPSQRGCGKRKGDTPVAACTTPSVQPSLFGPRIPPCLVSPVVSTL